MSSIPAAHRIALDATRGQIGFAADQAMRPQRDYVERAAKQGAGSAFAGTAPEDHLPMERSIGIEVPRRREGVPFRRALSALSAAPPMGFDMLCRVGLQRRERLVMEPRPDLGLPAAVEALDGSLEAHLLRGDKHWHHARAEAEPRDRTDDIGI